MFGRPSVKTTSYFEVASFPAQSKCFLVVDTEMAGVVGSRRDLIFVISELYYEVGGRHFVVAGKIAGCRHILTGLHSINYLPSVEQIIL